MKIQNVYMILQNAETPSVCKYIYLLCIRQTFFETIEQRENSEKKSIKRWRQARKFTKLCPSAFEAGVILIGGWP